MFYSEKLQSPISAYNIRRLYGVNPDTEPARALAIGIYPLTEAPEGYAAVAYTKEANAYTTVPSMVTFAEMEMVEVIRTAQTTLAELREALELDDY